MGLAVIIALAFQAPARVQATTVDPPAFATLVEQAEVIFSGEVIGVRSEWLGQGAERQIVSHVSFKILKPMKGNPPANYVLTLLGGTIGEETMEIVGAPKFKKGDRSILFIEHNGTQFIPLVGMMHGHYRITKDAPTGDEVLRKHDDTPLTGTEEIDRLHTKGPFRNAGAADPKAKPMKRADFESAIEQRLRGQK